MDLDLEGNAALVTASSSGLGKASATALAREGANVVVNGRDKARLDDAVREIREVAQGTVVGESADLTDPDDIERLIQRTVDEFGTLDHLVTSGGGPPQGLLLETSPNQWHDVFELWVMSVAHLVWSGADVLRADGGGTIVMIASRSAKEASDTLILSNALHMCVVGIQKTLSRELAPQVRSNSVLPGVHETSLVAGHLRDAVERGDYSTYEEAIEARSGAIPVGRIGDPMDLGNTVAFLCSDISGYINGVALPVDGGYCRSNL